MDRDEVALMLVVLVSGALVSLVGGLAPAAPTLDERAAWRRLWLPAVPALLVAFALLGFAVADPEGAQGLHVSRLWAMAPFGFVWLRTGARAVRSAWAEGRGPAMAVGLIRPKVVIDASLRSALEPAELRAVLAHERAHVRHRDPLRLWLAQALTDLQWPFVRPRLRQRTWQRALEIARDDEAVHRAGASPTDLARALVKVARTTARSVAAGPAPAAALADDPTLLQLRVRRLLTAEAPGPVVPTSPRLRLLVLCLGLGAFVFGVTSSAPYVAWLAG